MPYMTGVGSRETPLNILTIMESVGRAATNHRIKLRSGGALNKPVNGVVPEPNRSADEAFRRGAVASSQFDQVGMEIFLPWQGFCNWQADQRNYINAVRLPNYQRAIQIAGSIHPVFEKLSRGARGLHTRNTYQVLGLSLNEPSDLLVCYAIPVGKSGLVKGGTNTAVQLARRFGVPIYNLFYEDVQEEVQGWLNGKFPVTFQH